MTFQKLSVAPRGDCSPASSGDGVSLSDVPTVRARRARTIASQGRNGLLEAGCDSFPSRPRIQSQENLNSDYRRKRSFSMCESDEDDELASLSSTTSYQSASKHQKLCDHSEQEEIPSFLPSDSVYWTSSVSSASMDSSASSISSLTRPGGARIGIPRVNFTPAAGASELCGDARDPHLPPYITTSASSSTRSSPRSSGSSPRSRSIDRNPPSVFKRAQSDGQVLLRNCKRPIPSHTDVRSLLSLYTFQHTLSRPQALAVSYYKARKRQRRILSHQFSELTQKRTSNLRTKPPSLPCHRGGVLCASLECNLPRFKTERRETAIASFLSSLSLFLAPHSRSALLPG